MKIPDIYLASVQFKDPDATRDFAAYTAKLTEILQDIYTHLQRVKVVTAVPTATEMEEFLTESDVVILHDSVQTNRKLYYKYQGTVYVIDSA